MNSFSALVNEFEKALDVRLEKERTSALYKEMRYAVSGGGKRIRPLLSLLVALALGKDINEVMPIAIAIELIHTYSLIHDDLPAMDNDDFRRGRPTLHKVFGEGIAVLTGDALLNLAYEVLLENADNSCGYARGIAELARFAGCRGMVGGQYTDISGKELTQEEFIVMYSQKTSALLQGAAVAVAHVANAPKTIIAALSDYAYYLGIAFQIQDDLIEYNERSFCAKDYVSVAGALKAKQDCVIFTEKSVNALKPLENKQNLVKLAHLLLLRDS